MASSSTPDNLTALLARLADKLDSLEARLDRIEAPAGSTIAATAFADSREATKVPPFTAKATKGKGRAKAPQAPSDAKSAKKERTTRKAAPLPNPVPLPLAQTFTTEGKTDRHLVTVVIPDASAQHVIGQGGKGLKQVHDISGARVHAYSLATGSRDERHISIRGTDLQIGDALVVLGKRIARKKVRPPKAKKTGPTKDSSAPAPLLPKQQSSSLPRHSTTQRPGPSTGPRIVEVPTEEEEDDSLLTPYAPTVVMASPSPHSTPIVPTVAMGSPSNYTPDEALTPMQIDALRTRNASSAQRLAHARGLDPQEQPASSGRGLNTARRSRPGPPGGRGRG
jgi:hypothetical protein